MRNLFLFLKKTATFFEFLLLEIVAFLLIINNDGYQSNAMLSSCNHLVASTYRVADSIKEYFNLDKENLSLIEENTRLKARVLMLETVLSSSLQVDSVGVFKKDYSFLSAKAVYNTIDNIQNYIVIDRGTEDGVSPEMGVIDGDGVVGIVKTTSKHFSLVLPILNVQSRLSCRVNRGGCFGSLVWDAKDARYAMLEEIPRHVKVEVGDSIFTSGLSSVFPEGFLVGVVDDSFLNEDAANHTIKVRLACDFYSVNYVKVVRYDKKEEYDTIKTEI